jgi:hypothetical protein
MKVYDYVLIGSGPISIIESIFLNSKKKSVLIVDDKKQLGGAWVTTDLGLYGKLEIGCHIWSYNKNAYDFLKEFLQLKLIKLEPQPFFLKNKSKIPYDYKNAITTIKGVFKILIKMQFRFLKEYLKLPSSRVPIIPKSYLYPKGGARDFQESLEKKIRNSNVEIKLNSKIKGLSKNENYWVVELLNGDKIKAKKVIMTSTSSIKYIECRDVKLELEHSITNYTHYHIVIKGNLANLCSYIRVLDHEFIHRISDVTYQLESGLPDDTSVFLVGVFEDKLDKEEAVLVSEMLKYFQNIEIVNVDSQVIYYKKNKFKTTYIDGIQKSIINNMDTDLELLHTTDLIYGIHNRLPKWSNLFN